jgi:hypothetical protein
MSDIDPAALAILQRRFRGNAEALNRHLSAWDNYMQPADQEPPILHVDMQTKPSNTQPPHTEPFDFAAFERDIKRKSLALIAAVIAVLWVIHSLLN